MTELSVTELTVTERLAPTGDLRVLQRVVMPVDRDLDVLKLYVETRATQEAEPAVAAEADMLALDDGAIRGRRGVVVPAGQKVSFCTYFNAFPAGYWRRWTSVDEIVLRLRIGGQATVTVYRSTADGQIRKVRSIAVDTAEEVDASGHTPENDGTGPHTEEHRVSLSMRSFIDGGWYWFDLAAGEHPAVLESADWCTAGPAAHVASGRTSIGITTFNRPGFCVDQLIALGKASDVLEIVDRIFVVDQGTERIEDHPAFPLAAAVLGDRLQVIDQGNLGGSGGFARAMDETVRDGRSDYLLLLDDDIVAETEGILRSVAFADLARTPTIVGGHMFNLYVRSQLHAFTEGIERYRWWWGPAMHTWAGHDFAVHPLSETRWMHRRHDADYNGWWMCLIPVPVIEKVGLSMPMFIKWDDAEYCVRAQTAGFPTVSLPGAAVWHVPWQDKDDGIDWQAYFHWRNRTVTALTHSPYGRGGNLVKESLFVCVKHALAMQYSTAELMLMAIDDVLSGPEHMHAQIATKITEIRAFRADFHDAQAQPAAERFPDVVDHGPIGRAGRTRVPHGRSAALRSAVTGVLTQLKPVGRTARNHPQVMIPHLDQHWSRLAQLDSALVSSADGTKVSWYRRDTRRFLSLMLRAAVAHARLRTNWKRLSRRYRAAAPELTSPHAWRRTFTAAGSGRP